MRVLIPQEAGVELRPQGPAHGHPQTGQGSPLVVPGRWGQGGRSIYTQITPSLSELRNLCGDPFCQVTSLASPWRVGGSSGRGPWACGCLLSSAGSDLAPNPCFDPVVIQRPKSRLGACHRLVRHYQQGHRSGQGRPGVMGLPTPGQDWQQAWGFPLGWVQLAAQDSAWLGVKNPLRPR